MQDREGNLFQFKWGLPTPLSAVTWVVIAYLKPDTELGSLEEQKMDVRASSFKITYDRSRTFGRSTTYKGRLVTSMVEMSIPMGDLLQQVHHAQYRPLSVQSSFQEYADI